MSKQAYYEGVEVTIRGEKYIFPGLSLAQLEENMGEIEEIQKLSEEDSMKMICKISRFLYLAFSRNYPEVTEAEFKNMIDLRTGVKLFQYILAESGFEQGAPGSGEAMPAASA
jgi:hypothetical protein|nr:MAG TPA: tail assembly chaperone protein [Caudoviricetes sp.]